MKNIYVLSFPMLRQFFIKNILLIPIAHFEKMTFLIGPKYMEDPVEGAVLTKQLTAYKRLVSDPSKSLSTQNNFVTFLNFL